MILSAVIFFSTSFYVSSALAQGLEPASCPLGETCDQTAAFGAWGLIVLGVLTLLVTLIPARTKEEKEGGGFTMLSGLQARIDKETTGWRRFQWPLLGMVSIGLGSANLLGWL